MTRSMASIGVAALVSAGGALLPAVAPLMAQTITFTALASIAGPADLVEVHDGRAYIVAGKRLALYDLANPARPAPLGSYEFPEKIWGIRVIGSHVFVAADFFGLGILDVTNPSTPVLRGSVKTPGQAKNVAVSGGTALVADHMSGLDIIDVSDVTKPVTRGSYFLEGYARDVVSDGSFAYAVDAPAGLYVFDLSKPGPLEPLSAQQTANAPGSIELPDTPASPRMPRLAGLVGGGSLQVYDVTNPSAPVKVATYRTPSGRPVRATLSGTRAYIADGREGLHVVDLSNPAAPRVIGSHPTPSLARDVAVAGPLVLVVVGAPADTPREFKEGGVLVLRQSS
jgi:hypothetical protein